MCAIFGLIDYGKVFNSLQRERIIHALSVECEIRGTDATGFAFNSGGRLRIFKRPIPASSLSVRLCEDANIILGHTRMTTQGDQKFNYNNHPFYGKAGETNFALAHNGIIYNDEILRKELNLPIIKIETDSYVAVQILEKFGKLSEKSLAEMAEKISGSFVFTLLDERNNSYFVRGNNPLALYKFKAGFYIYASTEAILEGALKGLGLAKYPHEKIKTDCGDILKIDKDGNLSRSTFDISESDCYTVRSFDWSKLYNGESQEAWQLKNFANTIGIDSEDIDLLLDCGYDPDEIAELIYEPLAFQEAVYMAMECCYGEAFR